MSKEYILQTQGLNIYTQAGHELTVLKNIDVSLNARLSPLLGLADRESRPFCKWQDCWINPLAVMLSLMGLLYSP